MAAVIVAFDYPLLQYGDPALKRFLVPGTADVYITVRADVGPLLIAFAARFHATVESLELGGPQDDGGHNPRVIAGSTRWSLHAAAIAEDLNWNRHPQGKRHSFTPAQEAQINHLIATEFTYQGKPLIKWGIVFENPDPMHFELCQPRSFALAALAAGVGDLMALDKDTKLKNGMTVEDCLTASYTVLLRTQWMADGVANDWEDIANRVIAKLPPVTDDGDGTVSDEHIKAAVKAALREGVGGALTDPA